MRKLFLLLLLAAGAASAFAQAPSPSACNSGTVNTAYSDNNNNVQYLCIQNGSSYFWKANIGIGAPTVGCSSINYGAQYTDIQHGNIYSCGQNGWQVSSSGLPAFGGVADEREVFDATVTQGSYTLTASDLTATAADTGKYASVAMGTQGLYAASYVSGGTVTGAQWSYCKVTFATPSGGTPASGWIFLTSSNTIAAATPVILIPGNFGTAYTSAPTTATLANGSGIPSTSTVNGVSYTAATCSGTITLTSTLFSYAVLAHVTYVNSTTLTMDAAATTSMSGTARVSLFTDNTAALSACVAAATPCTAPAGRYGVIGPVTVTSGDMAIQGAGATMVPAAYPFMTGTVFVAEGASTDLFNLNNASGSGKFRDFGILFSPTIAFVQTGNGINIPAWASTGNASFGSNIIQNLQILGDDGNHNCILVGVGSSSGINGAYVANNRCNGGGGMLVNTSSATDGNATYIHNTFVTLTGGSQNAWTQTQGNLNTYIGAGEFTQTCTGALVSCTAFYMPSLAPWQMPQNWGNISASTVTGNDLENQTPTLVHGSGPTPYQISTATKPVVWCSPDVQALGCGATLPGINPGITPTIGGGFSVVGASGYMAVGPFNKSPWYLNLQGISIRVNAGTHLLYHCTGATIGASDFYTGSTTACTAAGGTASSVSTLELDQ